jgi:hypothetical protein
MMNLKINLKINLSAIMTLEHTGHGVLQERLSSAQRWLTSISATISAKMK